MATNLAWSFALKKKLCVDKCLLIRGRQGFPEGYKYSWEIINIYLSESRGLTRLSWSRKMATGNHVFDYVISVILWMFSQYLFDVGVDIIIHLLVIIYSFYQFFLAYYSFITVITHW